MIGRAASVAVGAVVARRAFRGFSEGGAGAHLERVNHRGEPVTLAEGPAVAIGSLAGIALAPGITATTRAAALLGVAAAAGLGVVDDLTGATDVKGLRGHLSALTRGEVTTGALKLAGLAATGLLAGSLARRGRGGVVDAVLAGGVVAGGANLVNLLDLRPGRASKVFLAGSVLPGVSAAEFGAVVAGPVGAAGALLPDDLGERAMLGDTGANALGAAWGVAAAATLSRPALAASFAGIAGLTLLSERVSFSAVIERTPALQRLDLLGRRPQATAP